MTFSVYMGRVVKVFNLDFSRIFDHVSNSLLLDELTRYTGGESVRLVGNWLLGHSRRKQSMGFMQAGSRSQVLSLREQHWVLCCSRNYTGRGFILR